MSFFAYRANRLCAEDVPLTTIAEAVGTPFYCYAATAIESRFRAFARAFADQQAMVCFALKANSNLAVIRTIGRLGGGADVVSGGEMTRALRAGIPPERIVFSGVGKTRSELAAAMAAGIHQINVESVPELHLLSQVAVAMGTEAAVALRINPDVDARTHAKISTGRKENKFGIDVGAAAQVYALAGRLPGLRPLGLALHIGSQLTDLAPFRAAFGVLADTVRQLRAEGLTVERLDLGGGLGIPYRGEELPAFSDYAAVVRETVGSLGCHLTLEPGRALVGEAGVLVARVVYVKEGLHRRFLILDAAMNDLMRPALYDAHHSLMSVAEPPAGQPETRYDVVGPVCETADTFAREVALPALAAGDLVAFRAAGAYGAVMSSAYNTRSLVPEVMVRGGDFAVIRRRPSFEEQIALEALPGWLEADPT